MGPKSVKFLFLTRAVLGSILSFENISPPSAGDFRAEKEPWRKRFQVYSILGRSLLRVSTIFPPAPFYPAASFMIFHRCPFYPPRGLLVKCSPIVSWAPSLDIETERGGRSVFVIQIKLTCKRLLSHAMG
jgi:hypothetical protein